MSFLVVVVCLGAASNVYLSRAYQLGFINSETAILIYDMFSGLERPWEENIESLSQEESADLILAYKFLKVVGHSDHVLTIRKLHIL